MKKTGFRRWAQRLAPLALITLGAAAAHAQNATINVNRFGIYESFGQFSHSGDLGSGGLKRTDVGQTAPGVEARNYFTFTLTGVNFTVTSATLRIVSPSTPQVNPGGNTNTLGIFDVTTTLAGPTGLTDSPDGTNPAYSTIFADLGSGTQYGSATLNPDTITTGTVVNIPLTGGLAAINAAGTGEFAVGGAITNLAGFDQALYFSGNSGTPNVQLILSGTPTGSVSGPEPGSLLLGVAAFPVAFAFLRRRKS